MKFAFNSKTVTSKSKNSEITLEEFFAIVQDRSKKATIPDMGGYMKMPELLRAYIATGCTSSLNKYKAIKLGLPYIIPSGFRPYSTGHGDGQLTLNGCINIDVDFKQANGETIAANLLRTIKEVRPEGAIFAGLSAGAFGVRMIVRIEVAEDGLNHDNYQRAAKQVIRQLAGELGVPEKNFDYLAQGIGMFMPFERKSRERSAIFPDAPARVITLEDEPSEAGPVIDIHYSGDELSDAARFLIESGADIAGCYEEYFKVSLACFRAFGPDQGKEYAFRILQNSETFLKSDFRRMFSARWKEIAKTKKPEAGRRVTGAYLIAAARKHGYRPERKGNVSTYQLKKGEYLNDAIERIGLKVEDVIGRDLIAGTGTGKTTFIAGIAGPDRKICVLLPTEAAVKNAAKKTGGRAFYGSSPKTRFIDPNDTLIFSTLASYVEAFGTRVDLAKWDVVIDEVHIFSTDGNPGFRGEQLRRTWEMSKRAKSVTTLTGTDIPNYMREFQDREKLIFESVRAGKKDADIVRTDNVTKKVGDIAKKAIARGEYVAILNNDKSDKREAILQELKGINVAVIDADRKESQEFADIVSGCVPKGSDVLIATTVMREGNDIREKRKVNVIFVGDVHSSVMEQFSARFRDQGELKAHIVKGPQAEKIGPFDRNNAAYGLIQKARFNQAYMNEFASMFPEEELRTIRSNYGKVDIFESSGVYEIDFIAINAQVTAMESRHEYRSDRAQAEALAKYGFTVALKEEFAGKIESDESKINKRIEAKKVREEKHAADISRIMTSTMPDQEIKRMRGKVADRIKFMKNKFNLTTYEAADLIKDAVSKIDFRRVCVRLEKQLIRMNRDFMESDSPALKVDRAIIESFEIGAKYTGEQILQKVRAATDLHPIRGAYLEGTDHVQRRKAIETVRGFFEVVKVWVRVDSVNHKWVYIIEELSKHGSQEAVIRTKHCELAKPENASPSKAAGRKKAGKPNESGSNTIALHSTEADLIRSIQAGKTTVINKTIHKQAFIIAKEAGKLIMCHRPHKFGNPFKLKDKQDPEERRKVIEQFKQSLTSEMVQEAKTLRGKVLACYCAPLPCHCDILKEIADAESQ